MLPIIVEEMKWNGIYYSIKLYSIGEIELGPIPVGLPQLIRLCNKEN